MNIAVFGAIGAALGSILTTVFGFILKNRSQIIGQYQVIVEQLRTDLAKREADVARIMVRAETAIRKAGDSLTRCQIETAELRGRIELLNVALVQMQTQGGAGPSVYLADALVLANDLGIIYHVNDACWLMFGYREGELIGKSIEVFIPDRYLEQHRSGFGKASGSKSGETKSRTMLVAGKGYNGSEFPIDLQVFSIQAFEGRRRFGALIRRRLDREAYQQTGTPDPGAETMVGRIFSDSGTFPVLKPVPVPTPTAKP